jgi:hypothetical protein
MADMIRSQFGWNVLLAAVPLISGALTAEVAGDESPLTIRSVEPWSGVFGEKETEFRFELASTRKAEVRASWSLASEGSVLVRRETSLLVTPDKPGMLSVRLDLPKARDGIVLPLDVTVSVELPGQRESLERRLWLFSDDPFALEREWLEGLKITLFDPVGETSRLFTRHRISFEQVRTVDQAAAIGEGVLIVGEGTSWSKQRALPRVVLDLASEGIAVLALAPSDGSLPLPGAENVPTAKNILFHRADVITQLDKRLDAVGWPPDGKLQASGLKILSERGQVVGRFVEGSDEWPWFECHFARPPGKVVMCGFSLVKHWESGPTPRHLFARILERLVDADKGPSTDRADPQASGHR